MAAGALGSATASGFTSPSVAAAPCPACGSPAFRSVLSAPTAGGPRALVSCSRCGLLRFLGAAQRSTVPCFFDAIERRDPARCWPERLLSYFRKAAAGGPLRFLMNDEWKQRTGARVFHVDAVDGTVCRGVQQQSLQSRPVVASPSIAGASRALHRHGIDALVADPVHSPLRNRCVDAIVRFRGFTSEADPAAWLSTAATQLRPGGRIYLQVFDCSSWAFLLCGSHWVGLEPSLANYAYRGEDVEVLFDLSGLRITRRSHAFPMLNTFAWASSLAPWLHRRLDPCLASNSGPLPVLPVLLYLLLVLALYPFALVESLCHAGSVLMIEAERKA